MNYGTVCARIREGEEGGGGEPGQDFRFVGF